jgi:lambda repressor-like predicted transcriptional regulator
MSVNAHINHTLTAYLSLRAGMQAPATELLTAALPHCWHKDSSVQHAALDAVSSICAMPMIPSMRSAAQACVMRALAASSHAMSGGVDELRQRAHLVHAAVHIAGTTLVGISAECEEALQSVLHTSLDQASKLGNSAAQLCALEPWALWMQRLAELEDDLLACGEHAVAAHNHKLTPYVSAAQQLVATLLPCLSSNTQVRLYLYNDNLLVVTSCSRASQLATCRGAP